MGIIKENLNSLTNFDKICRICLESHEDMVDIFKSGMEIKLMEVTNLQVQQNDNLPKSLCLNCICELDCFYKFRHKAKASDSYIRSVFINSEKNEREDDSLDTSVEEEKNVKRSTKRKLGKCSKQSNENKKFKKSLKNDKMYLIFVPNNNDLNSSDKSQICIRDLSCVSDNVEISQFCRTLIQKKFSDHTYPKDFSVNPTESEECEENYSSNIEPSSNDLDLINKSKIYSVNLFIYECSKCCEYFEESDDLTNHYLTIHNCQPPVSQFMFKCPVCFLEETNKIIFLKHLEDHKAEGILLMKVNAAGEKIFVKESERYIFDELYNENKKMCKIFKIKLNSIKCPGCFEEFESEYLIQKHAHVCFAYEKFNLDFFITYHCPICNEELKDEKSFLTHLALHQDIKYYYITVNNVGEPVKLINSDNLFLPFEEAIEINEFLKGDSSTKFFKITNNCSCDKCDYESESFSLLYDHYNLIHSEKPLVTPLFVCPVCLVQYNKDSIEENKIEFFEHLKEHKTNGFYFLNVKRNGSLSSVNKMYPEIFSQSPVLCDLINSNMSVTDQICCPELIIIGDKNSKFKYTCDLCKKHFKKKQDIIKHLKSHNLKKNSSDAISYICEKCGKKFVNKRSYEKHFFRHSKVLRKRATCSICHKTFANRETLNGHMGQHLKEGIENNSSHNKICEKCGKSFSNNASLTKHKKLHTKDKENAVLKCEICNRDFLRQSSYDRHKSAHLNPNYFECEICKLPLSSALSLQKHLESHQNGSNTFDCKSCKISFLTKDSLIAHQNHTGHYLDREPLECNVCHEKFFIGKKFTEHIKTHPKYKMGECNLCGKKLSTINSLMLHMSRHFESNCILCPHCGKQMYEKKNYHRHLLTHEGIKPFSCDVEGCEKSFYTLFELNRHKKYHNNTRDFKCSYCSKSFYEANHLTVHIRTHTGERPYTCPHCSKGFVTRTRCKQHIRLNHQGVGYDLIQSNISKKVTVFETVDIP